MRCVIPSNARILLVDDDDSLRRVTEHHLIQAGYQVTAARDGTDAAGLLSTVEFDLVLSDLRMPGLDGMALLRDVRRRLAPPPVIIITAHAAVDSAVEAMRAGAADYIAKPFSRDELLLVVARSLEHERLRRQNRSLQETLVERHRIEGLVAESPAMWKVVKSIERLASSDASVLIQGESGTGKELVARAIHFTGKRAPGPFVAVNCSAIPADLLESVLFGHLRGAFTGASDDREGKFEAADGGTLFLDEIGDMALDLQAKILRALQEREIERVGSNAPRRVDVRIIAATNQPLAEMIETGAFRRDLYYRLAVVPIRLPPLRERPEEIPALTRSFLRKLGLAHLGVDQDLLDLLVEQPWPGNVRELENLVERMTLFRHDEGRLSAADLPEEFARAEPKPAARPAGFAGIEIPDGGIVLEDLEKDLILKALAKAEGNKSKAARLLGISRQTLLYRLEKHGIE
ncbi:MAG: sigma-54-dependent Fis family transcriptional regulator [Candidatus Sumerlaeia bacterium]|nr:sigma-54-dependent Fis family transcriptional regulator [Candidatus Sumerlaeia bacterium]